MTKKNIESMLQAKQVRMAVNSQSNKKLETVLSRLNPDLRDMFVQSLNLYHESRDISRSKALEYFQNEGVTNLLNKFSNQDNTGEIIRKLLFCSKYKKEALNAESLIPLLDKFNSPKVLYQVLAEIIYIETVRPALDKRRYYSVFSNEEVQNMLNLYNDKNAEQIADSLTNCALRPGLDKKLFDVLGLLSRKEVAEKINSLYDDLSSALLYQLLNSLSPSKELLDEKLLASLDKTARQNKALFEASGSYFIDIVDISPSRSTINSFCALLSSKEIIKLSNHYNKWYSYHLITNIVNEARTHGIKSAEKLAALLNDDRVFDAVHALYAKDESGQIEDLVDSLSRLRSKKRIDKALDLWDRLVSSKEMLEAYKGNNVFFLHHFVSSCNPDLITDVDKLKISISYLSSVYYNTALPKPSRKNIGNYLELTNKHLESKFGLKDKLTNLDELMAFFSFLKKDEQSRLVDLINKSERKNQSFYSASKKFALNCPKESVKEYVVNLLLSPEKAQDSGFSQNIVQEETIDRARKELYADASRVSALERSINLQGYDSAFEAIREIDSGLINDVLALEKFYDNGPKKGLFIKAVESNNPLDFNDNDMNACVFPPFMAKSETILKYCADNRFLLVRYEFQGKPSAAAICYREKDAIVVDSVEGCKEIRKEENIRLIYSDLIDRAKNYGVARIIFNRDVQNKTPQEFIDYVKKKNLQTYTSTFALDTDAYIESHKELNGYVFEVNKDSAVGDTASQSPAEETQTKLLT